MNVKTSWIVVLSVLIIQSITAAPADTSSQKSENTAFNRSMLATMIPCALAIPFISNDSPEAAVSLLSTGIIFGPSFGHLYAENRKSFTHGVLTRVAGAGMFIGGVSSYELFSKDNDNGGSGMLILAGGIIILYSVIHDLATVDNSVRTYNQNKNPTQVSIYTSYQPKDNDVRINLALHF